MLLEFYGKECPHCARMAPLVERLKKDEGIDVVQYEVWHDKENAQKMAEYAKDNCGGVPFFFNTATGDYVCGEATYNELKEWALKK